ncbi:PEGA domain-containing protein [Vibrio rotiferianus]|uniref:PEGA domain-containing protein n=1 Tax=Vibrio rotiferianus TaxID=190895 RepID=UPI00111026EF|nr:PEGA domain-containing protein [Vibrio rotiferianus]TMX56475.1 hypothetical protein DA097_23420 [Vibrio rotiferianus]
MKKLVLLSSAILALSGCSTIINGASQQVVIRGKNLDEKVYVNGNYMGSGNVVTSFKKSNDYVITIEKEDCESVTVPVSKSFDPTTLLGLPIDLGVFSILLIDGAATGSWEKFDQTYYSVDLNCNA